MKGDELMVKNILIIQPTDNVPWENFGKLHDYIMEDAEKGVLVINNQINYQVVAVDDITIER
jgi:uncharacterized protein with NAD-binding domain and iron-sulfur cluster